MINIKDIFKGEFIKNISNIANNIHKSKIIKIYYKKFILLIVLSVIITIIIIICFFINNPFNLESYF
jgi:hypothetical protein